jgi:hypothetical protein
MNYAITAFNLASNAEVGSRNSRKTWQVRSQNFALDAELTMVLPSTSTVGF